MIYAIGIFIITLAVKLAIDVKLWMDGKANQHKLGSAIVFAVLTLCSYLAGWISAPMFFFGWTCIFNPAYALLIGEKIGYVGNTATLDKIERKFPVIIYFKYLCFAGSIILYIIKG